jgi:hypothetical protein
MVDWWSPAPEERGPAEAVGGHVDHPETHHVGVELHAALDVTHIKDRVVEPVNAHLSLPLYS